MTTLAQLHDCHSCNDERSIDQKKKNLFLPIHGILYCNSLGVSMGVQYGHLFLSLPDFWAVLILLGSAR